MNVGDTMVCDVIVRNEIIGRRVPVTVLEIKRHWKSQEPTSVRVKTRLPGKPRFIWVQPQYLHTETTRSI